MKLTQKFKDLLTEHFTESIVIDERGDGHHVEVILVDSVFDGMTRIERSRHSFACLKGFVAQVHAITVKCFTPQEWNDKKGSFEPTKYVHIKK